MPVVDERVVDDIVVDDLVPVVDEAVVVDIVVDVSVSVVDEAVVDVQPCSSLPSSQSGAPPSHTSFLRTHWSLLAHMK